MGRLNDSLNMTIAVDRDIKTQTKQKQVNFPSYSKLCENGHSKIDKTKILMTNGSLMKVESIAECSPCNN